MEEKRTTQLARAVEGPRLYGLIGVGAVILFVVGHLAHATHLLEFKAAAAGARRGPGPQVERLPAPAAAGSDGSGSISYVGGGVSSAAAPRMRAVDDPCTGAKHFCDATPGKLRAAYVLSLYELGGSTIDDSEVKEIDATTFFDYAYAAVLRLATLTDFPIVLLCNEADKARDEMRMIANIRSTVEVTAVPNKFIRDHLKPSEREGRQMREKHKHTYNNLYIYSPEFGRRFEAIAFIDVDMFIMRNVDEVFCARGSLVPTRRPENRNSDFNSGFYVYRPAAGDWAKVERALDAIVNRKGELKRGIQGVLNVAFGEAAGKGPCLPVGYNCAGWTGPPYEKFVASTKCGFQHESQLLLQAQPVIHAKLSMPKYSKWLPTVSRMWAEYLPPGGAERVPWLAGKAKPSR